MQCSIFTPFFFTFYMKFAAVNSNFWSISTFIQSRYHDNDDFRLLCPKNHYVSAFESEYSNTYHHTGRAFKLRCTTLPSMIQQNHCKETRLTEPIKKFVLLCDPHYYVVGLRGVPGLKKGMAFRLYCCTSYQIEFAWCKNGPSSDILTNFRKSLSRHDTFFTGLSSIYYRPENDRTFAVQYCRAYPNLIPIPFMFGPFSPRSITTAPVRTTAPPVRLPTRKFIGTPPPAVTSWGENVNELTDDDLDIIIIPSSDPTQLENRPNKPENDKIPIGTETKPFVNFDAHCPTGQALRTLSIRKVNNGTNVDVTFLLDCQTIPFKFPPLSERTRKATFVVAKDRSVQSPCDYSFYEYVCGLLGVYGKVRRLAAHCCSIENLRIRPFPTAIAVEPSTEGSELKAEVSMQHFIGNLDQIFDGSFVAHIFNFEPIDA